MGRGAWCVVRSAWERILPYALRTTHHALLLKSGQSECSEWPPAFSAEAGERIKRFVEPVSKKVLDFSWRE